MAQPAVDLSLLSKIPALEELDPQALQALVQHSSTIAYHKDGEIFSEGEPCDSLWVILSGSVRLLTTTEKDGHEMVVGSHEAGDYFGEDALLPGYEGRRTATAVATEDSMLLQIRAAAYRAAAPREARVIREIKRLGTERICQDLMKRLGRLQAGPLVAGAAEWLHEEAYADGDRVYAQGDPADRFYMVLTGVVRLLKREDGGEKRVARLGPGNHFGEQALIRSEPRAMTAQAEGPLRVASLSAERFLSLHGSSLELRAQLQRLTGFCRLADKGIVTLHAGKFADMDSVTAMYHFGDGIRVSSTKVVGRPIFSMRRVDGAEETAEPMVYERPEDAIYRQLILQRGRLVATTVVGDWVDLGRVAECISENRRLWPWQLALFELRGELWLAPERESFAEGAVVCRCTGVTRGVLNEAVMDGHDTVEKLAEHTGASRVCGACAPLLAEIVGRSDMDVLELMNIMPVSRTVRSFRFRPRGGPAYSSLPGQHLRIEAQMDGRWVQRSYTLTSPAGQQDYYEITVKREPNGVFSGWLHDRITAESVVRASRPVGEYYLPLDAREPAICLAGGIGVTPALAMVRSLKQLPALSALHLDYSALRAEELVCAHELRESAEGEQRFRVDLRATQAQGQLRRAHVDRLVRRYPGASFYLCGPKPFEDAVRGHLAACGVPQERIRIERFAPAGDASAAITSLKGAKILLGGSLLAAVMALAFFLLGPIPHPPSVRTGLGFEFLWTENAWKQLSGYAVLGLMLAGMGMSLRKRWRRVRLGNYAWWRVLHLLTGLLALTVLVAHTGMSLGEQLNRALLSLVLLVLGTGALVGMLAVLENRYPHPLTHRLKAWLQAGHIALAWPIPVLLVIHIVSAYYF